MFFSLTLLLIVAQISSAFRSLPSTPIVKSSTGLAMIPAGDISLLLSDVIKTSFQLADTSISEEEVLSVAGQVTDLPSPIYAVLFAVIIFAGVAGLQFSLGDLTKQEGQARVRDFLQTRRDTERKRGYFDD
mmetsp:Transcript_27017/g.27256  ORF Transcript_27017/g.27256 Transcript_27017/m.27256 type:complete len:131 (-) Transcript_27017:158-550(-)